MYNLLLSHDLNIILVVRFSHFLLMISQDNHEISRPPTMIYRDFMFLLINKQHSSNNLTVGIVAATLPVSNRAQIARIAK